MIFTEPVKNSPGFISWHLGKLFKAYLNYHDVWIGEEQIDFTITYNEVHKFYDVSLFHIRGDNEKAPHIEKAIRILKENGALIRHEESTWRWENRVKIKGKRFWIQIDLK